MALVLFFSYRQLLTNSRAPFRNSNEKAGQFPKLRALPKSPASPELPDDPDSWGLCCAWLPGCQGPDTSPFKVSF